MARALAYGMTIVLAGALLGWAILGRGGGSRKADPGTHISPALYQRQLNAWCGSQTGVLAKLSAAFRRHLARRNRRAIIADLKAALRWNIAFGTHFEETPVPAGMKARMAPAMERMAEAAPTLQTMLAGLQTNNPNDFVAGAAAVDKLYKKSSLALRHAGLTACD